MERPAGVCQAKSFREQLFNLFEIAARAIGGRVGNLRPGLAELVQVLAHHQAGDQLAGRLGEQSS